MVQQRLQFLPERSVSGAGFGQELVTRLRRASKSLVVQQFDPLPTFRGHACSGGSFYKVRLL
jgi:hypothetical protein